MIAADHRPDGRLVARGERADGRLDAVGEHDQRGLARLRLRSRVAELALVDDHAGAGQLLRPGVEVAHDRRPVVLRDERDERLRQAGLVGEVDAVDHVLLEDLGADLRVELVVDVVATGLVLDERERVRELADVVVVGRHAGHQRVGADRLGRALGQVADHQRVVVRAGRLDQQPAQERLRRVGQLEQLEDGQDPEHRAERRERCRPRRRPSPPPRRPRRTTARGCRGCPARRAARRRGTTSASTTKTATAAWTKTCSRSPAGRRRCRPSRRGRCRSRTRASRRSPRRR